jgi:hypothetical protein
MGRIARELVVIDESEHSPETIEGEGIRSEERVLAYAMARPLTEDEMRNVAGGRLCDTASPNCDAYA